MDAEPPNRKHCWFQFSLRTLLIGITLVGLLCAYIGWELRIVRDRTSWHGEQGDRPISLANSYYGPDIITLRGDPAEGPGLLRRWLGDSARDSIIVSVEASEEDIRRAMMLFPEAQI